MRESENPADWIMDIIALISKSKRVKFIYIYKEFKAISTFFEAGEVPNHRIRQFVPEMPLEIKNADVGC